MKFILIVLSLISCTAHSMDNPVITPTQEEYELFKLVKKLRVIAHECREEIRRTMGFDDPRPIADSEPNQYYGQTKKGIFLVMSDFPEQVFTPWGRVDLVKKISHRSDYTGSLAASQLFFTRVQASIHEFMGTSREYNVVLAPITRSTDLKTALEDIAKKDLASYIGTSKLLIAIKCGHNTIYRVNQIDAQKVPEAQMYDYTKQYRNPEEVEHVWKLMEARYKKENQ